MLQRLLLVLASLALVLPVVLGPGTPPTRAAATYAITDLGADVGPIKGFRSQPYAINASGQVVGEVVGQGVSRGYLYTDSKMLDLFPNYPSNAAYGINDAGQVVGVGNTQDGRSIGLLWQKGTVTELGSLPGFSDIWPRAINNAGQVVGYAYPKDRGFEAGHAFLYRDGQMTDIGTLLDRPYSAANAINNTGQIVGEWRDANRFSWAFLYSKGQVSTLPVPSGIPSSEATDINDAGQVIGQLYTPGPIQQAVIWQNGKMQNLRMPTGFNNSSVMGINNAGDIVGYASRGFTAEGRAFLWRDGAAIDLNETIPANSGWILNWASDINEAGQIVGTGKLAGQEHSFLLTPVPTSPPVCAARFPETGKCVGPRFLTY